MRLFTGLELPGEVVRPLEALLARLRPLARLRWSPPANLHITTKFIGEWPEARLPELRAELAALAPRAAIQVQITQAGFFPNDGAPRLFGCAIHAPGLAELAAETDLVAASLGIARERRPYSPHLTLARIKDHGDLRPLQQSLAASPPPAIPSVTAGSFFLYQSQLRPTGSVYTKLAEFPFSKQ